MSNLICCVLCGVDFDVFYGDKIRIGTTDRHDNLYECVFNLSKRIKALENPPVPVGHPPKDGVPVGSKAKLNVLEGAE